MVTGVMGKKGARPVFLAGENLEWTRYVSYEELINMASTMERKITLHFLTPTSFRRGNVDFPLPDPRLLFGSYQRRFAEFADFPFLENFAEQVEYYTRIARLHHLNTNLLKTKKIALAGFTGSVTYQIDNKAPPDLVCQLNMLADFAFFCGTGRKTTVGMGQTVRSELK